MGATVLKKKSAIKATARQVYREIIARSKKKVSITLPEALVGKTVEVFAFEVSDSVQSEITSKSFSKENFWETFGSGKGSTMSAETIREKGWRRYTW